MIDDGGDKKNPSYSKNLKDIDKLVKARMDVPILTYNKNISIGGLTSPLDIPNRGYVDEEIKKIDKSKHPVSKNLQRIDDNVLALDKTISYPGNPDITDPTEITHKDYVDGKVETEVGEEVGKVKKVIEKVEEKTDREIKRLDKDKHPYSKKLDHLTTLIGIERADYGMDKLYY